MAIKRYIGLAAVVIATSISSARAGPCSSEIDSMQARINAKLETNAAAGPSAKESAGALVDRQPTPSSIARAEESLGEVSTETVAAIKQALERARAADSAGDKNACEQALAEVQRLIGP